MLKAISRLFGRATAPETPEPVTERTPRLPPVAPTAVAPVRAPAPPIRSRARRHWEPERLPPTEHAKRLLAWCQQEDGGVTGEVLAEDLIAIHAEMCGEQGIAWRPWNPVAAELRRLTTGRKDYRWVVRDGVRHRLRVYFIPDALAPADRRVAAAGSAGAGQRPGGQSAAGAGAPDLPLRLVPAQKARAA